MQTKTLNLIVTALVVICLSLSPVQGVTIHFHTPLGNFKQMSDTTSMPAEIHAYTYGKDARDILSEADCELLGQHLIDYSGSTMDLTTAHKFNIEQKWVYLSEDPNSTAYFNVDPISKTFVFNKSLDDGFTENSDTQALPSDLQAPELALRHLAEMDLLPMDEELHIKHVGGVSMAILNEDGSTTEYDKLRTVVFGRQLNGLEVKGSSRIVMQMGTDGDMLGLIYNWPTIKKKAEVTRDMLSGSYLQARVSGKLQALYRGSIMNTIDIWDAELVMYDDGAGTIEPALLAKGQTYLQDGTQGDGDWIIPCLRRPRALYTIDQRPTVAPDIMETEPQSQTDEDDE